MLLLGMLIVTNEFYHQTATTTFLTTPHRTGGDRAPSSSPRMLLAAAFWVVITGDQHRGRRADLPAQRGRRRPPRRLGGQRAILMNLLAFVLWAVLGVGLGVLIRSQIGAMVTGALLYLIG